MNGPSAPAMDAQRLASEGLWLSLWLAWLTAPHAGEVPTLCLAVACALLALRWGQLHWRMPPWPRSALLLALLGVYAATAMSHDTLWSKEAGVSMVVMLAALKNLETHHRRDLFVGILAGMLLVLTHFLRPPSFGLTLVLAIGLAGLLGSLVRLSNPVHDPGPFAALGLTVKMVLWGTPLMVLMFVLFPRVGPLWGQSVPMPVGATGLNDRLQLGDIASLAQDDRPALRLRWRQGALADPRWLYLRGPVLSRFDGVQWTSPPDAPNMPAPPTAPAQADQALDYDIFLEPSTLPSVPTVATTHTLQSDSLWPVQGRQDGSWISQRALTQAVHWRAKGQRSAPPGGALSPEERSELLRVPAHSNPRTVAWARAQPWAQTSPEATAVVHSLMQHVAQQRFRYTLSGLNRTGASAAQAIDAFWLDTREGYCEHFAAAFALILRSVGIPARIVTGYQGAEVQPIDGQWLVRQQRAHAWVEYWHPPAGWMSVDPTTAMGPEQIAREPGMRMPPGLHDPHANNTPTQVWHQLQRSLEWVQHQWRLQVLGYDTPQQLQLLRGLGWQAPGSEHAGWTLGTGLAVLLLLWAGWQAITRPRPDAWQRLLVQMRQGLTRAGLPTAPHMPVRTLADLAHGRWGQAGQDLVQALLALDQWRYGPNAGSTQSGKEFPALRRALLQALRRLPRAPQD